LAYEIGQQLAAAGQPPGSIVILDTPSAPSGQSLRLRDVRSIAANAPRWLRNELQIYGAKDLARRLRNRLKFRVQAHGAGLEGIFDLSLFPESYQRRMFESHHAFVAYKARPTKNRVVYLHSRVRSLIHLDRPDGGWGQLVPAPQLTILPIPGDHGSVLAPRFRNDVALTIQQALAHGDTTSN